MFNPISGEHWIVEFNGALTLARKHGHTWLGCEQRVSLWGEREIEPVRKLTPEEKLSWMSSEGELTADGKREMLRGAR